jgi:hypothetical protein
MIRALDERNAHPRPNGLGLHEHLGATALEFGRGRIHVIDTQPQMIQSDASAASVSGSQKVISIPRYISIAVDSSAQACSRWPVTVYSVLRLRWQWA